MTIAAILELMMKQQQPLKSSHPLTFNNNRRNPTITIVDRNLATTSVNLATLIANHPNLTVSVMFFTAVKNAFTCLCHENYLRKT